MEVVPSIIAYVMDVIPNPLNTRAPTNHALVNEERISVTSAVAPDRSDVLEKGTAHDDSSAGATQRLAQWVAAVDNASISESAYQWATHATLDWLSVTVAGAAEPLVRMLALEYGSPAANASAVLRDARRDGVLQAALINGSAGHALDFDDVAARMNGHPSVPVLPAVLALAQVREVSGRDFLRAVVVGHEIESRIGEVLGASHYARGFHATGTIGTFGAAAAAASLLGLDAERSAHALGLAAAQAAGLKSMFGTMAKPLHAGKAAMNGLMAAQLAARGFTADTEAIEGFQGFAWTQADDAAAIAAVRTDGGFAIEQTLFKYHAACYLTHATIEAIRELRRLHAIDLDALESLEIFVPPGHLSVCDIPDPRTGLNLKFSIRQLALLALDGFDSAALNLYTDEAALNPRATSARIRVRVTPSDRVQPYAAAVTLKTRDGRTLTAASDVGVPSTDPAAQWSRLCEKARAITAPSLGMSGSDRLVAWVEGLANSPTVNSLMDILE